MPTVVRIHLHPLLPARGRTMKRCGSSSVGRALAFQAKGREFEPRLPLKNICLCSSGVEHFLGKEEVAGSNPAIGSKKPLKPDRPDCVLFTIVASLN